MKKGSKKEFCKRGHKRTPDNVCSNNSCRLCVNAKQVTDERRAYNRNWYKENPDAQRQHWLNRYNLTLERFNEMVREQNSCCFLCHKEFGNKPEQQPTVDHDHACCAGRTSCGKCVRRLLCRVCNAGLGAFNDNIEILHEAIAYLESFHNALHERVYRAE